jgi:hypothetical protein
MTAQLQLFPRKALIQYPKAKPTADSLGEVEADDGFRYFIKGDAHGKPVKASEWLGTHLAESVGISAPAPCIVELQDGTNVFGSRRIAGVADAAITTAFLTTPSASNKGPTVLGLQSLLSKIYAYDMFFFNDDRHLENYLSVDDNGVRRLYAFDFSRALLWHWPWNGYPVPGCNTRSWGSLLRRHHGFDESAASGTLDAIASLAPATLQSFVNLMPSDWMTANQQAQFLDVWTSGNSKLRVDAIRKGFQDGSLL